MDQDPATNPTTAVTAPYEVSQQPAIERLQSFIAEVKAVSSRTEVIVPKYFKPAVLATRPTVEK